MLVDFCGARGNVRDSAAGEARGDTLGKKREVCQREEAAVALPERDPFLAAKAHEAQILEVADDGACQMPFEEVRLSAWCIGTDGLCTLSKRGDGVPVDVSASSGATLVGQDDAEMFDGLLNPAVARGGERTRAFATWASL